MISVLFELEQVEFEMPVPVIPLLEKFQKKCSLTVQVSSQRFVGVKSNTMPRFHTTKTFVFKPGFHYTTNATTTTQKQSDCKVEQSSCTLIALF